MLTTAEGVETAEQLSQLRMEKCNEVQGYLFSSPVDPSLIPQLLERWNGGWGNSGPGSAYAWAGAGSANANRCDAGLRRRGRLRSIPLSASLRVSSYGHACRAARVTHGIRPLGPCGWFAQMAVAGWLRRRKSAFAADA